MRMRKKQDLPQKICAHCGLPFTWRKKWEAVWDEVKYCSDRCRRDRKPGAIPPAADASQPVPVARASKPRRAA